MTNHASQESQLFGQWKFQKYTDEKIVEDLLKRGYVDTQIEELKMAYKKSCRVERSQRGVILIITGAIIGFLSCLFTLLGIFPDYQDLVLVGLTTLGVIIAVSGCYCIFE